MIVVLGAGLTGLSFSHHAGHDRCLVLEESTRPLGLARTEQADGAFWDIGPHVSFTKHAYVRHLQQVGCVGRQRSFQALISNHYRGSWISHPAQSHLHQLEPGLRQACLSSVQAIRALPAKEPAHYGDWLERAFGPEFTRVFAAAYTRKYWTVEPEEMTVSWIGRRIFYPDLEQIEQGAEGPLPYDTHYITRIRYPQTGGYASYFSHLAEGANIRYGARVERIDLERREVTTADGAVHPYSRLVSTIPLDRFVEATLQAGDEVRAAARRLARTDLSLVNVLVPHPPTRPESWLYVYDEDYLSTRITLTTNLSPEVTPPSTCGLQVEVYAGPTRPLPLDGQALVDRVVEELAAMGLIAPGTGRDSIRATLVSQPYANVLFDHAREAALDSILDWLSGYGLEREEDDLDPVVDWERARPLSGPLLLGGRFAQWKYLWSDDCTLRGAQMAGLSPASLNAEHSVEHMEAT